MNQHRTSFSFSILHSARSSPRRLPLQGNIKRAAKSKRKQPDGRQTVHKVLRHLLMPRSVRSRFLWTQKGVSPAAPDWSPHLTLYWSADRNKQKLPMLTQTAQQARVRWMARFLPRGDFRSVLTERKPRRKRLNTTNTSWLNWLSAVRPGEMSMRLVGMG